MSWNSFSYLTKNIMVACSYEEMTANESRQVPFNSKLWYWSQEYLYSSFCWISFRTLNSFIKSRRDIRKMQSKPFVNSNSFTLILILAHHMHKASLRIIFFRFGTGTNLIFLPLTLIRFRIRSVTSHMIITVLFDTKFSLHLWLYLIMTIK